MKFQATRSFVCADCATQVYARAIQLADDGNFYITGTCRTCLRDFAFKIRTIKNELIAELDRRTQ